MGDSDARSDPDDLGIDGYTDATRIGQGGFGSVYRCRQVAFDRFVAVKVLAASGLSDAIEGRFERECRAIGALSGHPHILTVHDSGVSKWERPFIVMDYMVGGSLAERVRQDGPMAWSDAVAIGVKIAGAVAAAHSAGVVHRDIKPQNILMSSYEEPNLGDFGISTIPSGYQTHSGVVTTSLAYAPPEVLNGEPATKASDIYSLAATILSLIKGSAPFVESGEEGIAALVTRTLTKPVPDMRRWAPDSVCAALERAMSKNPADRQSSAAELGHELRSAQAREGASPTPFVGSDSAGSRESSRPSVAPSPIEATRSRDRRPLIEVKQDSPPPRRSKRRLIAMVGATLVILGSSGAAFALRDSSPSPGPVLTKKPATPAPSKAPEAAPSRAAVRNFTIAFDRKSRVLTGDLVSSRPACASRRAIELWKRTTDHPIWKGRTSRTGAWRVRIPQAVGAHYARVYEAKRGDALVCRAARSRAVVLRASEPRSSSPSRGDVVGPSGGIPPVAPSQPPKPPQPPTPSPRPSDDSSSETPQEEADCPPGNHVEEDGRCYPD